MATLKRIAVIIVNYNMPEAADANAEYIERSAWPHDLIVVDNGSNMVAPAASTTLRLSENRRTLGGMLAGLEVAQKRKYLAYYFVGTSTQFEPMDADPLEPLGRLLLDKPDAAGVTPAWTGNLTAWTHQMNAWDGTDNPRESWLISGLSAWRAPWLDTVGAFDPALTWSWGIDYETCYKARRDGKTLWVHPGVRYQVTENAGYIAGRMGIANDERQRESSREMHRVFADKYGLDWPKVLLAEDRPV